MSYRTAQLEEKLEEYQKSEDTLEFYVRVVHTVYECFPANILSGQYGSRVWGANQKVPPLLRQKRSSTGTIGCRKLTEHTN